MTSCIYIYYTPSWQELADIVLPKVKAYCEKHNHAAEIVCADWSMLPVGSYKMHVLLQVLRKYDFVWVLDLDTLITNDEIDFMSFTDNDHDIFICTDVHGINAGSWIVRNTESSIRFIHEVIQNFDAPEEQTVMKRYIHLVNRKILPHPSINSYKYELYAETLGRLTVEQGQWKAGDLLLHLPGLSLERRIEILKSFL